MKEGADITDLTDIKGVEGIVLKKFIPQIRQLRWSGQASGNTNYPNGPQKKWIL